MNRIEIVRTSDRSCDVYIEGVKQNCVVGFNMQWDESTRQTMFSIVTGIDDLRLTKTYVKTYTDFTLEYRDSQKTPDDRMREAWGADAVSDITRSLIDQLTERDAKGRQKYGTSLDRKDLSLVDWLQHQTEELLDAAGYARAAKREAGRLLRIEVAARDAVALLQGTVGWEQAPIIAELKRSLLP